MHEMKALPGEVMQRVALVRPGAPIELVSPVRHEAPQPVQLGALFPTYAGYLLGPARLVQSCTQIFEQLIRDMNPERLHYNNTLLRAPAGPLRQQLDAKSMTTWAQVFQ